MSVCVCGVCVCVLRGVDSIVCVLHGRARLAHSRVGNTHTPTHTHTPQHTPISRHIALLTVDSTWGGRGLHDAYGGHA